MPDPIVANVEFVDGMPRSVYQKPSGRKYDSWPAAAHHAPIAPHSGEPHA